MRVTYGGVIEGEGGKILDVGRGEFLHMGSLVGFVESGGKGVLVDGLVIRRGWRGEDQEER